MNDYPFVDEEKVYRNFRRITSGFTVERAFSKTAGDCKTKKSTG